MIPCWLRQRLQQGGGQVGDLAQVIRALLSYCILQERCRAGELRWKVIEKAIVVGNHELLEHNAVVLLFRRFVALLEDGMIWRYRRKHSEKPVSLRNLLSHEIGKALPLCCLLLANVPIVVCDELDNLVSQESSWRRMGANRAAIDVSVHKHVTLPVIHLFQHGLSDEGVPLFGIVLRQIVPVLEHSLVHVISILDILVKLLLAHHI